MVNRRDVLKLGAGAAVAAGLGPGLGAAVQDESGDATEFYVAAATGDQVPVETDARGGAFFSRSEDGSELYYVLAVGALENVTQAHIHRGAPGENGDVVVWLYPDPQTQSQQLIEGRFDGTLGDSVIREDDLVGPLEGESLDALVELLNSNEAYVNVHTEQNPGGEIRGQITPFDDLLSAMGQMGGADGTETPEATPDEETPTEETPGEETPTPTEGEETPTPTETETPADETPTPTPTESE